MTLERFLQSINSPGAHILICLCLLVAYTVLSMFTTGTGVTTQSVHDVIVFAMGVLSRSMGSGNKEGAQPPNTLVRSMSETVTAPAPEPPAIVKGP
jgi:hypothetical protein